MQQDNLNNLERRTAIVAQELLRYKIAIAALSETWLPDSSQLTENGTRYTFFYYGRPKNEPRQAVVGFAINNQYLSLLDSQICHLNQCVRPCHGPHWWD